MRGLYVCACVCAVRVDGTAALQRAQEALRDSTIVARTGDPRARQVKEELQRLLAQSLAA